MNLTRSEAARPDAGPALRPVRLAGPSGLPDLLLRSISLGSVSLALAGLLTVGACSSVQPPTERMNGAAMAIREAEQADAVALAPAQMQSARDAYTKAEGAMHHEEYVEASRLAEEAAVDAKLASATARAARAQRSLEEIRRSQQALEQEATH